MDGGAATFAVIVTLYFWRENIKGIPESSEKALRIMYITSVMVVLMVVWCLLHMWFRGRIFRLWPHLHNITYLKAARRGARLVAAILPFLTRSD